MKKLLSSLIFTAVVASASAASPPIYGVRTDTNGLITAPSNFFAINGLTNSATIFVDPAGNDANASRGSITRFRTITAAKAAAQAGDTICVFAGTYSDNNLLKAGVNYSFSPGVSIRCNPQNSVSNSFYGIFDDRSTGGTTNCISGRPDLFFHTGTNDWNTNTDVGAATNCWGAVVLTNTNTVFFADLGRVSYGSMSNLNLGAGLNASSPFVLKNCKYADIRCLDISDMFSGRLLLTNGDTVSTFSTGIYWELGEVHFFCPHIGPMAGYGIWPSEPPGGPYTNNFYFTGDLLEQKIYQSASDSTYKTWFNIKQIQTTNAGAFECVGVYGGKLYLTGCDKISDVGSGVTCISVVVGEAWIDSQKVTSSGTGVENAGWISQTGGTLWANIGQFEDGGSMTNGIICNSATADMHIRGNFAKVNNGTAIIHLAGTNHTSINVIDTSTGSTTNAKPVVVSAVGMCLGGTCLLAPASTPTIWASSAQTVSLFNFCSGNSNVSANITLHNSTNYTWDTAIK